MLARQVAHTCTRKKWTSLAVSCGDLEPHFFASEGHFRYFSGTGTQSCIVVTRVVLELFESFSPVT
jgi:hypothetical protein